MRHVICGTKGTTMSGQTDPFDLLRAANPVDPTTLPGPDAPEAQAQLERIFAQPRHERRALRGLRSRRLLSRPRLPYLIPVVAALMIGAGAAAWALTRTGSNPLTIGCYAAPSLTAHTAVIGASGRSPVEACRALWQQGALGPIPPGQLQACILPSGAIGVFPNRNGGDVCQHLALTPFPSTQPPSAAAVIELKDKLVDTVLAAGCLNEHRAEAIVQKELDRLNLHGWTVRATGSFTAARPCATLGFDPEQHAVLLIPAPQP